MSTRTSRSINSAMCSYMSAGAVHSEEKKLHREQKKSGQSFVTDSKKHK